MPYTYSNYNEGESMERREIVSAPGKGVPKRKVSDPVIFPTRAPQKPRKAPAKAPARAPEKPLVPVGV